MRVRIPLRLPHGYCETTKTLKDVPQPLVKNRTYAIWEDRVITDPDSCSIDALLHGPGSYPPILKVSRVCTDLQSALKEMEDLYTALEHLFLAARIAIVPGDRKTDTLYKIANKMRRHF